MTAKRRFLPSALPAAAMGLACACAAPQVAFNAKADFSAIRRVAVAPFSGAGGEQAGDMLTQDLLARGADVVERGRLQSVLEEQQLSAAGILEAATVRRVGRILGVDALFVGTVTKYFPGQSYLVSGPGTGTVVVGGMTPIEGRGLRPDGPVAGLPDSQVLTSAARVGLIARLVDVESGSVLWSARMNYEGLDPEDAMASITASFADSLMPIWTQLKKPR